MTKSIPRSPSESKPLGESPLGTPNEFLLLWDEKEKRLCQNSYYYFFKKAWSVLEPQTPLLDNWHIQYLCQKLEGEVLRISKKFPKTKDLIINIPPRSAKSYLVSVMLCPWAWTRYPHLKFIGSSYSNSLSITHCLHARRLIESDWYQSFWGKVYQLTSDQNVKSHFENNKGGIRLATSVSGSVTGHGADIIIADDLVDPKQANSAAYLLAANDHYDKTLFTRLNDQTVGLRVVVMQRNHQEDTTGHLLKRNRDGYEHICIPAEKDEGVIHPTVKPPFLVKFYDENGLFFPSRFSKAFLEEAKKGLGSREYAGQYLQSPAAKEGNILKRQWWRYYSVLPPKFDEVIQSWDMNFKEGKNNSYVVGQVWGRKQANIYLIDQFRQQIDFTQTIRELIRLTELYPKAYAKLIEAKANGPAILSILKDKVSGLISVEPEGSKESRVHAISSVIESGNVYLPHSKIVPWVEEFIDECSNFPNGAYDDQVDAMSQALSHLASGSSYISKLEEFLKM